MLGVGVSLRHMRGATSALAFYAANGLRPTFVLDPSRQKYFVDGSATNLAGAVTHSRASGATYLDSTGTLQTAASGEIRDQAYTYVDGVLTGPYVLTEPDAVNLITYSEEFDNASWVKSTGVTVTANTDVAPDGTTSADTVTSGANQITQGVSCVQNTVYTDSLFFKKTTEAAYTPALYLIFTGGTAATYAAVINTNTGVHTVVTASGFTAPSAVSVSDAGAYWRLSVSGNSGNNTTVDLRMYPNFNPVTAGVGPGSQVIWGAQLEAGSIPTSYIPTFGSQGARAEDVLTIPDAPWPSGDPGSRAIGISMKGLMTYADTNSGNELNFLNQEVGNDQISYRLRTSGTRDGAIEIFQRADGVLDTAATASDSVYFPGINVPFSIASRHGDSFLNGAVDGTAMSENTTPTILPDLSAAPIAIRASGGPLYIEEMRIWVEGAVDKITDALIEEASAP